MHRESLVIYPPVTVEDYSCLIKRKDRENMVLTISRIDESKGLDLIPNVAAKVNNTKFVIIGSLGSKHCLQNLHATIQELGLEKRVIVIPNASEKVKKAYLAKSKIYLHACQYEAFGISVVEAMASGLVPIVYKNGTAWTEILRKEQGLYGYGYVDVSSCAIFIEALLHNDSLRNEIANRSLDQALRFDRKIYRKTVVTLIEKLLRFRDIKQ
jgi:glycosyltransferase involved in cell wall biosynthesis